MEKGLIIYPRTKEDAMVMEAIFEDSSFYVTWSPEHGCFFMEEEEECYDTLEKQVDYLFENEYGESLDGLELELWLEAEISER